MADGGSGLANTLKTEYLEGRDEIAVKQEWNGNVESPASVFREMGIAGWKISGHQFLKEFDTYSVQDWTSLMPSTYTKPAGVFAQQMVYGKDGNMYYTLSEGPYNDTKYVVWKIKPNGAKEKSFLLESNIRSLPLEATGRYTPSLTASVPQKAGRRGIRALCRSGKRRESRVRGRNAGYGNRCGFIERQRCRSRAGRKLVL